MQCSTGPLHTVEKKLTLTFLYIPLLLQRNISYFWGGEFFLLLQDKIFLLLQEKIHPPPPAVEKGNIWSSLRQRASWLLVQLISCAVSLWRCCAVRKVGRAMHHQLKPPPVIPPHTHVQTHLPSLSVEEWTCEALCVRGRKVKVLLPQSVISVYSKSKSPGKHRAVHYQHGSMNCKKHAHATKTSQQFSASCDTS